MRTLLSLVAAVSLVGYPVLVYLGLTRMGTRQAVLMLLPVLVIGALARIPREQTARWREALTPPLVMALLLGLTAAFDDHRFLLATPVLISLVLLAGFAGSLATERPLVERFARLQVDDLSPAEVTYCRTVTLVWSGFFVVNALAAGLLGWLAPLSWWTLYTGLIAYLLIGLLGASEYVVRKYRFGRFGDHVIDRVLRALLARTASG